MEAGRRIAHFEILSELGSGGMGVVYRARDTFLDREVALKVIQPEKASPGFRHRFLTEARIAATLSHPGIAAVYEAGEAPSKTSAGAELYVAEELIEGESLATMVARGRLPMPCAADFVLQLLEALSHAHARGVVHRDIKPANLMITPAGRVKVLDFGIAKRLESSTATTRLTEPGVRQDEHRSGTMIAGTPAYMAPEQLRGFADQRTDLFATSLVFYELLAGQRLTARTTLTADVPAPLARVLDRAAALDPADRFADAAEFAGAIRHALGESPDAAVATPASTRRNRLRMLAVPATVTLAVALLLFGAWRWSQSALAFGERDLVLIAGVVNETGDVVFDAALEGALDADLRQSRHVNVFDQGQVARMLTTMKLPASQRIDVATGREMCRLAGIRALLVPAIRRVGSVYQLEATLIEPASGRVASRLRVAASGKQDVLLNRIDELTRLIRSQLGETLESIGTTDPQITEFASSSLEAIRYARLGGEALAAADVPRATRAFEQAIEHDPKFSAALGSLGLLYIEFLNRPEEGKRMLAAAREYSSPASAREHFVLLALNKQFVTNDLAGALEDYRFVSSLYPDMFQPVNNSGRILAALGRYTEAIAMFERAHALDPRHSVPLWNLWELTLNRRTDPRGAERYAKRIAALQPGNPWVRHMIAWTDVSLGRFEEAEQGMREVLSMVPLNSYAFANLGHLLMRRGAAREAAEVYRDLHEKSRAGVIDANVSDTALLLGLALAAAGQADEGRRVHETAAAGLGAAPAPSPSSMARLSTLYAAAGRKREAERLLATLLAGSPEDPAVLYQMARSRALLSDVEGAAALLRRARAAGYDQPYFLLVDPALRSLSGHPVLTEIAVPPTR